MDRFRILTNIAREFLGAIKDTFNVFARYISDRSLIIEDFKYINWGKMLTMVAGGAFAGIMLLTCGASLPIIFAGYGVGKQLMGITYDINEYEGIDNLLKATDCKDIFEYGGNQLFYLAINTYSGYKAGQRLEAAWKNRTNKKNSNKGASGAEKFQDIRVLILNLIV